MNVEKMNATLKDVRNWLPKLALKKFSTLGVLRFFGKGVNRNYAVNMPTSKLKP